MPLVRAVADDVVGVEVGDDAGGCRVDQIANAVVRHGDRRGIVRVGCRDELSRVVVGIVGDDTSRPRAAGEFAVRRVGIG